MIVSETLDYITVRSCSSSDLAPICSWVPSQRALRMISGDTAERLTPEILRRWQADGLASIVISSMPGDTPIGFCTLSTQEAPALPPHHIEICHLVVDPRYRHLFVGPRLVRRAKAVALALGYRFVLGRVNPNNRWTLTLARHQRFHELVVTDAWMLPDFRWFRFDLAQATRLEGLSAKKDEVHA